jgi:hypothetical protein
VSNKLIIPGQRRRMPMVALGIVMALSATPASAQTISAQDITPEMRAAFEEALPYCEADAAKFCSSVVPGGGRIAKCMLEHLEDLSPICQEKIQEAIQQ